MDQCGQGVRGGSHITGAEGLSNVSRLPKLPISCRKECKTGCVRMCPECGDCCNDRPYAYCCCQMTCDDLKCEN
jgi:hypothetical protein